MARKTISTGTRWEPRVGYSRAVRTGDRIFVSGTTATDSLGNVTDVGNAAAQTRQIIKNIDSALHAAGSRLSEVVRTRVYIVNVSDWEAVGDVHGEFFGEIRPASSLLVVSKLIHPDLLVEIEADAIIGSSSDEDE